MPIIPASNSFEGSSLDSENSFSYLKESVKQLLFTGKVNVDGVYVLFLPAYKRDQNGEGVWFKKISLRDNFGVGKFRKRYVVKDINSDPASYFESNFKGLFPDQAKPVEGPVGQGGYATKIYPSYGRVTTRVLFNVALLTELKKGAAVKDVIHVLDLPLYKGASEISTYMNKPRADGTIGTIINDPKASVPFFIKKDIKFGWSISADSEKYIVHEAYADSNNLYNLDDVCEPASTQDIINDLCGFYSNDIVNRCLQGYPGFTSLGSQIAPPNTSWQPPMGAIGAHTNVPIQQSAPAPYVPAGPVQLPAPGSGPVTSASLPPPPIAPIVPTGPVHTTPVTPISSNVGSLGAQPAQTTALTRAEMEAILLQGKS